MSKGIRSRDIAISAVKVGAATIAGLAGWLVAGKVLALQVGAAGVGLFGLLRQLAQTLTLVASLNGQNALVQGIASTADPAEQGRFAGTVLKIYGVLGGALALVMVLAAPWIAPLLIPHPEAATLLRWLALAVLTAVFQSWALGVLNGYGWINQVVWCQLAAPVAVILFVFPMVWLVRGGFPSAYVLMLAGPPAVVSAVAVRHVARAPALWRMLGDRIDAKHRGRFLGVSGVLLTSALVSTGAQYAQNLFVARRLGLDQAGQFWAAWTLGMSYVTIVLGSYGAYYMPSLSRLTDRDERIALMRKYMSLSLTAMPLLVAGVILFKPWVIRGIFSSELLPALRVMRWMLIGDVFKGISWVLAFPMLAFREMKLFFWSEVLFATVTTGGALVWLTAGGGIEGLGALFAVGYALYLIAMWVYARVCHGYVWMFDELRRFAGGLALVGCASALTWNAEAVAFSAVVGTSAIALLINLPELRALGRELKPLVRNG